MKAYVLCIGVVLVGCGADDENESSTPPIQQYSMALATEAELPACDAAHDKQLVYITETKEFQTCQAGAWAKVELPTPEPVAESVDPAEVNLVKNALATIKVYEDTLETMLPEAREIVLSGEKKEESPTVTAYTISKFDDAAKAMAYYYIVRINSVSGKVAQVSAQ